MSELRLPATWDRKGLEAIGFEGFLTFVGMDVTLLPPRRGIYAILRPSASEPEFLNVNPIKRRPPYTPQVLEGAWIAGAPIVYIGKAEPLRNPGLRGRLAPFSKKSSSHTGGRSIWQLADADDLVVAWLETPDMPAHEAETIYISEFKRIHGSRPFANKNK